MKLQVERLKTYKKFTNEFIFTRTKNLNKKGDGENLKTYNFDYSCHSLVTFIILH